MILSFLDSAKAGLLKNVQNYFLRCFRSREISKTKVGTFFWNTLYMTTIIFLTLPRISLFILSDNRSKQANHNGPHKWSNKSFSRPYSLMHEVDETWHIAHTPSQSPLHLNYSRADLGKDINFSKAEKSGIYNVLKIT